MNYRNKIISVHKLDKKLEIENERNLMKLRSTLLRSLIIHKANTVEDVWKSEEEITYVGQLSP